MYELPPFAASRYRLEMQPRTAVRGDLGLYDRQRIAVCLASARDVHSRDIPAAVRDMIRLADAASESLDDPIGLVARIALCAARLKDLNRPGSKVADAFDGDWASVFEHLLDAFGDLGEVVTGGAEDCQHRKNTATSASELKTWREAADYATYAAGHLENAAATLRTAAQHVITGQGAPEQSYGPHA